VSEERDRGATVLPHRAAASRASGSLRVLSPAILFEAVQHARADLRLVMREPGSGSVAVVVFSQGEPAMVFSPGDGRSVGELLLAAGTIDHDALAALVSERQQGATPLERLVLEQTTLTRAEVQRVLDYQARMRLLDALTWRDGFFEIEEYRGGAENAFRLILPNLASLVLRADARAEALPNLMARLPASPALTLVRRRRGAERPGGTLEASIFEALAEPCLLHQLIARLLVDDDLVIHAVLAMAAQKLLVLEARASLVAPDDSSAEDDPRCASLARQVLETARGAAAAEGLAALWVVVVAAAPEDAMWLVTRIGGEPGVVMVGGGSGPSTGLASRTLRMDDHARLCLLAVRPESLSRGALEGVLARCDGVVLVRTGDDPEEEARLQQMRRLASGPGFGWQPLTLGLELGAGLRPWSEFPDAVLGVPEWRERGAGWLAERFLEGLLAAASGRASRGA
jgi:hypothetical protein